jgi:hypothetical protein
MNKENGMAIPDDWIEPDVVEFTCPGCGRLIIGITMFRMWPRICGACLTTPCWLDMPEMAKALDPFGDCDPSLRTMTTTEVECRSIWLHACLAHFSARTRIIEDVVDWDRTEQQWLH